MKWLILVMFLCEGCRCTFSVTPIPTHRNTRVIHSTTRATHTATKAKFVTVDADWMDRYTKMEKETNYVIHGDDQIQSVNGKFRVPQSVIDHYSDMLQANTKRQ